MITLNTEYASITSSTPAPSYPTGSSNQITFNLPTYSLSIPKPVSYEFRVAEYYADIPENVVKVGLQVQVYEHNQYGTATILKSWTDVERVKVKL